MWHAAPTPPLQPFHVGTHGVARIHRDVPGGESFFPFDEHKLEPPKVLRIRPDTPPPLLHSPPGPSCIPSVSTTHATYNPEALQELELESAIRLLKEQLQQTKPTKPAKRKTKHQRGRKAAVDHCGPLGAGGMEAGQVPRPSKYLVRVALGKDDSPASSKPASDLAISCDVREWLQTEVLCQLQPFLETAQAAVDALRPGALTDSLDPDTCALFEEVGRLVRALVHSSNKLMFFLRTLPRAEEGPGAGSPKAPFPPTRSSPNAMPQASPQPPPAAAAPDAGGSSAQLHDAVRRSVASAAASRGTATPSSEPSEPPPRHPPTGSAETSHPPSRRPPAAAQSTSVPVTEVAQPPPPPSAHTSAGGLQSEPPTAAGDSVARSSSGLFGRRDSHVSDKGKQDAPRGAAEEPPDRHLQTPVRTPRAGGDASGPASPDLDPGVSAIARNTASAMEVSSQEGAEGKGPGSGMEDSGDEPHHALLSFKHSMSNLLAQMSI